MQGSPKSLGLAALSGLVVGLLVGFLPSHFSNTKLEQKNAAVARQKESLQGQLDAERNRLTLSNFTVQAGVIKSQVDAINYSVAGSAASALFTDLRRYVESSTDTEAKQQISEVLAARDRTIAGLAQASPGTRPLLQQIFVKLQNVSAAASQSQ